MERTFFQRRQAACGFSCWASKHTPFFQTIKVIAAIFRAKVRRAIEGRPFGEQSLIEIVKGAGPAASLRSRTFEDVLEIMVVVFIETTKYHWFLRSGTSAMRAQA